MVVRDLLRALIEYDLDTPVVVRAYGEIKQEHCIDDKEYNIENEFDKVVENIEIDEEFVNQICNGHNHKITAVSICARVRKE